MLREYERKAKKNIREKEAIEDYLFSGTDTYLKADRSVEASFKKAHENLEKKYRGKENNGKPLDVIDYSAIHAEFKGNNTNENDIYGDGQDDTKKEWDPNTQKVQATPNDS